MIRHEIKTCSECQKLCGRRSGVRHGFLLCGRCIKKNCLPNIFKKTHPDFDKWELQHKLKRVKGYRNLKDYEKRFLWIKHVKKGESAEQATLAIKGLVEMVKNHSYQVEEKKDFQSEFNKLVGKDQHIDNWKDGVKIKKEENYDTN